MVNGNIQKVVMVPTKNVAIAILLAVFLGPLGMFYSTTIGAIIMLILYPIVWLLTLGFGVFILHPIAIIWAMISVNRYNKKLLSSIGESPSQNINITVSPSPQTEASKEKTAPRDVIREKKPGIVESAMAKGLINQAQQLEATKDEDALEQACLMREEALNIGSLTETDELLCHYRLGSYYFSKENIVEGTKHHQKIALHDPKMTFLQDVSETAKNKLMMDLYKNLSTGWQSIARNIKEKQGIKDGIDYLSSKVDILSLMATPSILYELGSYYSLYGKREKAKELMNRALDSPTYGSDFQENAKKLAREFLITKENDREDEIRIDQLISFGPEPAKKSPALFKWIAGAALVVCIGLALYILLPSGQYKKYYSRAQEAFDRGDYSESMTFLKLAKERKLTEEVGNLDLRIRQKIKDEEMLAEKLKKQREYNEYYDKARSAFGQKNYSEALTFANLAAERISTQEVGNLKKQIQGKARELETSKIKSSGPTSEPGAITTAGGDWDFGWDGQRGRLPLTIVQNGKSLRIQLGRLQGSGTNEGQEVIWTVKDSRSGAQSTNDFTGKIDGNTMYGWSKQIIRYSDGRTRTKEIGWTAYRKIP